ncbi:MAG TPA: hypothetical protein VJ481_01000 [Patescibacteria group bacterium]|uniref:Uncharacterized protein n=1 Tax=Candidatus Woesebacteria bacterium RBG_13_46_13 TaxID=1802479 RepID=A0A1F7X5B7_9BACT|nr:MAG: hypothetical protein A2Y68_02545 [Candidatus Woesebacteria bacterium RBG_13_46_13]HJX59121.1 hypothetical protein [Patescibacteria group bacterium]
MAKRRTRREKASAKHGFALSWEPSVKGQFISKAKKPIPGSSHKESAITLAKDAPSASIKRDILKSLIIVSLILALEVVLYLAWNK